MITPQELCNTCMASFHTYLTDMVVDLLLLKSSMPEGSKWHDFKHGAEGVEGDQCSYWPSCKTNLVSNLHKLCLMFFFDILSTQRLTTWANIVLKSSMKQKEKIQHQQCNQILSRVRCQKFSVKLPKMFFFTKKWLFSKLPKEGPNIQPTFVRKLVTKIFQKQPNQCTLSSRLQN